MFSYPRPAADKEAPQTAAGVLKKDGRLNTARTRLYLDLQVAPKTHTDKTFGLDCYSRIFKSKARKPGDCGFFFLPANLSVYLALVRKYLQRHHAVDVLNIAETCRGTQCHIVCQTEWCCCFNQITSCRRSETLILVSCLFCFIWSYLTASLLLFLISLPSADAMQRNVLVFSQLLRRDLTADGATRKVDGCLHPAHRLEGEK